MGGSLRVVCLWPRKQHVVKNVTEIDCLVILSSRMHVSNLQGLTWRNCSSTKWPFTSWTRKIPELLSRPSHFDKCYIDLINKDSQCFLRWTVSTKGGGYVNGN